MCHSGRAAFIIIVLCEEFNAPTALPTGKEPPAPIDWQAGWASEPVWTLSRRNETVWITTRSVNV